MGLIKIFCAGACVTLYGLAFFAGFMLVVGGASAAVIGLLSFFGR